MEVFHSKENYQKNKKIKIKEASMNPDSIKKYGKEVSNILKNIESKKIPEPSE